MTDSLVKAFKAFKVAVVANDLKAEVSITTEAKGLTITRITFFFLSLISLFNSFVQNELNARDYSGSSPSPPFWETFLLRSTSLDPVYPFVVQSYHLNIISYL